MAASQCGSIFTLLLLAALAFDGTVALQSDRVSVSLDGSKQRHLLSAVGRLRSHFARQAKILWPVYAADPINYFLAVNDGLRRIPFERPTRAKAFAFALPMHQMAARLMNSEAFDHAATVGNVTSWSSETHTDEDGNIVQTIKSCFGQNCSTETTQLPTNGNASDPSGHKMKAQRMNHSTSDEFSHSPQDIAMNMDDIYDILGEHDFDPFMDDAFSDPMLSPMGPFGSDSLDFREDANEASLFDILGSDLPSFQAASDEDAANVTSDSWSESSEQYVRDGQVHEKVKRCNAGKCTSQETTRPIRGAISGDIHPENDDARKIDPIY